MKEVISIITLALLQISCYAVNVETMTNLNAYYPEYSKIDLVCEQMPKNSQKDVEFCCEAAFTGELLNEFKHSNIADNHICDGVMKKGYRFYTNHASSEKLQRLVGELQFSINQERLKLQRPVGELTKQPVSGKENYSNDEFPLPFALVPWGQHIEIITRSESLEEALFYMQHVIEKGLSRPALVNCYKA